MLLAAAAVSWQAAFAQPHVESAHYWASDGAVDVRLDGPALWVDSDRVFLTGSDNHTVVHGTVSYGNDTISITLGDSKADFEGMAHPRYAVVLAGGVNGTDGSTNPDDMRMAITYDDAAPPTVSAASYDAGNHILRVSFDEPVSYIDAQKVAVYGADDTDMRVDAVSHNSGSVAVRVSVGSSGETPYMFRISAGGVADIWGNANAADLSYSVPAPPLNGTVSPPVNGTVPPTNGTVSPPTNGTVSPPVNGTQPPLNGTVSPPVNGTQPPLNGTVSPPVNGTQPPLNGTVSPPVNGTQPPLNGTVSPPVNGTQPPLNGTVSPPVNGTQPPLNGTVSPPVNGTQPPLNGTVSPPVNGTQPPLNGTVSPPVNGTQPPLNGTVSPPVNGTQPPLNGTVSPPVNGTQPPLNGTVSPPVNGTQPPLNGTVSPPVNGTQPPLNGTVSPPVNGTQPPLNGTVSPPVNGTQPPLNGTVSPPVNGTQPPLNGTVSPPVNGTQPPLNGTVSPPVNGTISIQFSGLTYNTVTGELRFDTDYDGVLFAPAGGKSATLTGGIYSATIRVTNPDCPDPLEACTGNGAAGTVEQLARTWLADSPAIYVNAPPGILVAGVPGNITGMTAALNHSVVAVPNPVFVGAAYYTGNGTVSVQFDKDIGVVNGSKIGIVFGANATYHLGNSTVSGGTVYIVLSDADGNRLAGAASLTIRMGEGAVTGTGGYPNAATGNKSVTVHDGIGPYVCKRHVPHRQRHRIDTVQRERRRGGRLQDDTYRRRQHNTPHRQRYHIVSYGYVYRKPDRPGSVCPYRRDVA